MVLEVWLAFAAASAVMLLIPGPTVLLVVSYALGQGWRAALPMALGVALGDFTAMAVSLLGLDALLAASAALFGAVKWAGAAYLVWMGVRLWRAGGTAEARPREGRAPALRLLAHAWLVTALNPKGIVFFLAFLPQFIDPARPAAAQLPLLAATFLALAFLNALGWALLASRARGALRSPGAPVAVHRVGGGLLAAAGIGTMLRETVQTVLPWLGRAAARG